MRSHKFFTVFLLSAVTIMIIVTFVFWGIGTREEASTDIVAQVGKETITQDEYWRAYDNAERYYREIYKTEEEMKKLNLKDTVLYELINGRVLMIAANKIGIKVTEEELQEVIMNNPIFQKNGVFDSEVYVRALSLNRMTPAMYEGSLMKDMVIRRMEQLIGETAEFTEDDRKILDMLQGDQNQLAGAILSAKRELAIKAYVQGLKRQMKIKINKDLIS